MINVPISITVQLPVEYFFVHILIQLHYQYTDATKGYHVLNLGYK